MVVQNTKLKNALPKLLLKLGKRGVQKKPQQMRRNINPSEEIPQTEQYFWAAHHAQRSQR